MASDEDFDARRLMVIQRVRNPEDDSSWVDIAITIGYWAKTGLGAKFRRTKRYMQTMQLGDPEERSDEFVVETRQDLVDAAEEFADQHPD